MTRDADNIFSATSSAMGYLFQCRYGLFESLRRLRKEEPFTVSIETLDDVVFEKNGDALDLLQTKHHIQRAADLTDASPDLWKTIRIWCEGIKSKSIPINSTFFLITTSTVTAGSAASYLKCGESRDLTKALERLTATANSSTNITNKNAFTAFSSLTDEQRASLLSSITIIDAVPIITDLNSVLREELYYVVEPKFLASFLQRLEGWWFRRVITHLADDESTPILNEELVAEINSLREQFKQENLPVDDDILSAAVDASGFQDRIFVLQLKLIEISNQRIFHAIRNYYRAFEQRSRWVREDLLLVGELDRYEDRLVEEWDILFQQTLQELGEQATEEAKKNMAQIIYKWVETGTHHFIRPGVSEPCIARGTYQILSDNQRVGWHSEFSERLKSLLEPQEVLQ